MKKLIKFLKIYTALLIVIVAITAITIWLTGTNEPTQQQRFIMLWLVWFLSLLYVLPILENE